MNRNYFFFLVFLVFLISSCGTDSSSWEFGITSVDPPNGAANVPLDQEITVTFNSNLNWDTIVLGAGFNVVNTATGVSVGGTLTQASPNTVLFTPDGDLEGSTQYNIIITAVVEDIFGNIFGESYTSTFSTIEVPS
jgi:hypothetical protein